MVGGDKVLLTLLGVVGMLLFSEVMMVCWMFSEVMMVCWMFSEVMMGCWLFPDMGNNLI